MASQLPLRNPQLQKFEENNIKHIHQKLLSEALVYLKLREVGCEKHKAISFAKKKEKAIDGTMEKDGPPGYRNLEPVKDSLRHLRQGWAQQKLQYKGTGGYTRQILENVSEQKKAISGFNSTERAEEQRRRRLQKGFGLKKWITHEEAERFKHGLIQIKKQVRAKSLNLFQKGPTIQKIDIQKKTVTPNYLEQINLLREDIMRERELRPIYVTFQGQRMQQLTKNYLKEMEEIDANGLVARLGVFEDQYNHDINIQPGEGKQIQWENKRQKVNDFRQSLRNWKPESRVNQSQPNLIQHSINDSVQRQTQLKTFYNKSAVSLRKGVKFQKKVAESNIFLAKRSSQVFKKSMTDLKIQRQAKVQSLIKMSNVSTQLNRRFKSTTKLSSSRRSSLGTGNQKWKKEDQQFEEDLQKLVILIQMSKLSEKKQGNSPKKRQGQKSEASSPLARNHSLLSTISINAGENEEDTEQDPTALIKSKIWNL